MLDRDYGGTTYKINQCEYPAHALCECDHPMAAHGSRGYVCGVIHCPCRLFKPKQPKKEQNN